ncbi:MAG TPA: hypothetical protein VMF66_19935 [Candidatus Acidoferrum sp.]|nr:hypothetical protein [Candidatus Acidoferrum sp.]
MSEATNRGFELAARALAHVRAAEAIRIGPVPDAGDTVQAAGRAVVARIDQAGREADEAAGAIERDDGRAAPGELTGGPIYPLELNSSPLLNLLRLLPGSQRPRRTRRPLGNVALMLATCLNPTERSASK